MQSYYGTGKINQKDKKDDKTKSISDQSNNKLPSKDSFQSCCKETFMVLTAILGVLSLGVIIALNAANLVELYRNKGDSSQVNSATAIIVKGIDTIQTDLNSEIKPKVELINNAASFRIPTLIGSHSKLLQNDIIKYCAPRYQNEGKECPIRFNPVHSSLFRLIDPWSDHNCVQADGDYSVAPNITFYPFPSFIPSPTAFLGCSTEPTFSLSENIYSYAHITKLSGCYDLTNSKVYWVIGNIKSDPHAKPYFENVIGWPVFDKLDRESCSTVAGSKGAWLGCSIVTQTVEVDVNTTGIQPLNILYMDVFGNRRQWTFQEKDIQFDRDYDMLYFSVGSGIIRNGKVIFLAYGSLREEWDEPAFCYSPGCTTGSFNQTVCNKAQRPPFYKNKQTVNCLIEFNDDPSSPPRLMVRTIPPGSYDIGSEGRLYYFPHSDKVMVYKKSASWHSYLFYGVMDIEGNLTINWFDFITVARPGTGDCPGNVHCPRVCVTGVYNDYFPLARDGNLGVTMMLRSNTNFVNPTIRILTSKRIKLNHSILSDTRQARYTTTSCFIFDDVYWCVQIVELRPGTIGLAQPVSLLFPVQFSCVSTRSKGNSQEGSGDEVTEDLINNGLFKV